MRALRMMIVARRAAAVAAAALVVALAGACRGEAQAPAGDTETGAAAPAPATSPSGAPPATGTTTPATTTPPPATAPDGQAPAGAPAAAPVGAAPDGSGPVEAPLKAERPAAPSFTGEQNRREVSIFFQKSDSDHLGPERRKIFTTSSPADQAKQIVVELINGPHGSGLLPTVPPQTRLLGVYLDRTGTAYVDLSQEMVDNHPGGTDDELATLFSLVDSITYNLPEIKRVHFLVGGEERDVLKGHLDLRRDYGPDMSLVDLGGST